MDTIKDFQKQSRIEQIRRLVYDRIRNEGYTIADFQKEYTPSKQDLEEFKQIEAEAKQ